MKKKTLSVILFVCVIVAGFFIYQITVKDGGLVKLGYNAFATQVNKLWGGLWGDPDAVVLGYWDSKSNSTSINVDDSKDNADDALNSAID